MLAGTGKSDLSRVALRLLDVMLTEYPQQFRTASAFHTMAECHFNLGDDEAAFDALRKTIETERIYPREITTALSDFEWRVATRGLVHLYDEVLRLIDEFEGQRRLVLPIHEFRHYTARAFLSEHSGDLGGAQRFATMAIAASEATQSKFRFHRKLGLVSNANKNVTKRLRKLAEWPD